MSNMPESSKPRNTLRERINRWPMPVKLGVVLPVLIVALAAIGMQLRSADEEMPSLASSGQFVFKCSDCGHEFEPTAEQVRKDETTLYRRDMSARMTCPKCGKATARLADRCPNDGTLFFPEYASLKVTEADRCPKCGWSRLDEIRKEMRQRGIDPEDVANVAPGAMSMSGWPTSAPTATRPGGAEGKATDDAPGG